MKTAKFIGYSYIKDDDDSDTELVVYKHESGGIFALDASFVDQVLLADPFEDGDDTDDINVVCVDPFSDVHSPGLVKLIEKED